MVISKKVEEFITKGGSVSSENLPKRKRIMISQAIREDVLLDIKNALKDRPGITRSAWIQEAITEKLKRLKDVC